MYKCYVIVNYGSSWQLLYGYPLTLEEATRMVSEYNKNPDASIRAKLLIEAE